MIFLKFNYSSTYIFLFSAWPDQVLPMDSSNAKTMFSKSEISEYVGRIHNNIVWNKWIFLFNWLNSNTFQVNIPFNDTMEPIQLHFNLANRIDRSQLVKPKWRISIVQLECPQSFTRVHTPSSEVGLEARIWDQPRPYIEDAPFVAPTGCLQYYTLSSGLIQSFNFNNGNGVYMGDMRYSICFRRIRENQQLAYEYCKTLILWKINFYFKVLWFITFLWATRPKTRMGSTIRTAFQRSPLQTALKTTCLLPKQPFRRIRRFELPGFAVTP